MNTPAACQNWVLLDSTGHPVTLVYARSRLDAMSCRPWAADARPERLTGPDNDLELHRRVIAAYDASYGRLD